MSSPTLKPADELAKLASNPFPGESDAYFVARRALLAEEIEFRRHMTRVAEQRRARQLAFAQERGWHHLDFVQTAGDAYANAYANDLGLLNPDGTENPALVVYRREGDTVRLFWSSAMKQAMADPGQDPRDAPDIASLWSILDLTPEGRGTDWYPKLAYSQ